MKPLINLAPYMTLRVALQLGVMALRKIFLILPQAPGDLCLLHRHRIRHPVIHPVWIISENGKPTFHNNSL